MEVGEGSRDFFHEAEWPRLDLSQQASKWGYFPRSLRVSKLGDWEDRSQFWGVASWDPVAAVPVSLPHRAGGCGWRSREGAELPPSDQGWGCLHWIP